MPSLSWFRSSGGERIWRFWDWRSKGRERARKRDCNIFCLGGMIIEFQIRRILLNAKLRKKNKYKFFFWEKKKRNGSKKLRI